MISHKELIQNYEFNLKIWDDYTKALDVKELEMAGNYLIGSICSRIKREDLKTTSGLLRKFSLKGGGHDENSRNSSRLKGKTVP